MKSKATIVDLPVYKPGKPIEEVKRELGLTEVIKLASNENPFGFSPKVKEAIEKELEYLPMYPDGSNMLLSEAVSSLYLVKREQLLFGNGSDEIIQMIARAYLVAGDESVMAESTFPQYRHNSIVEGATVIEVPLKEGTHDLAAMLSRIGDKTKIVWICNPNNPTSTIVKKAEFLSFVQQVPKHVLIVMDEAYCEYINDEDYPDSISLLPEYENLVILRTFSKIYGLAALRIGYAIASTNVIHHINQVREPFNTNRFAQAAALAAVQDQDFVMECRQRNAEGIAYITEEVRKLGISCYPAFGNFILIDTGRSGEEVFHSILREGIIVRYDAGWKLPNVIRVTVGSMEQNKRFIEALQAALSTSL